MSDANCQTNSSSIELSDIRKLDILLTQCESDSCENICIDCCAKLGSMEDDVDDNEQREGGKNEDESSTRRDSDDSACDKSNSANNPVDKNEDLLQTTKAQSEGKQFKRMASIDSTRNFARQDLVISNVPTIISSHVTSPPPLSAPVLLPNKANHNRLCSLHQYNLTHKSNGCDQLSFDNDTKSETTSILRTHRPSASDENTYCTKCGNLLPDKRNFPKKRYFSLDKERNEKNSNLLDCPHHHCETKSGSENMLTHCRKHCSFEDSCEKPNFGKTDRKPSSLSVKQTSCEKCDRIAQEKFVKSPPSKKSSSCSNHSLKEKSNIRSQTSLRDSRSRKNSMFCGERERSSQRPKLSSSRKASTRTQNLHDEQDTETREILLGSLSQTHSKFDVLHHDIKIPEPVEAVCILQ